MTDSSSDCLNKWSALDYLIGGYGKPLGGYKTAGSRPSVRPPPDRPIKPKKEALDAILHTLVSVRPVAPEDFEQWLEYRKAYQAFYEVELSAQATEATWRRFDEGEPMHCAVATDGSRLHGIVNFLYHRSTWAAQDVCYLEDLYVSPDVRGQQIGKQLIEYVRRGEERRCARLYWHTQESNHRAQRLYDWVADKPG